MSLGELAVHTVQNPVLVNEVVSEAHVRVACACVPKKSEEKKSGGSGLQGHMRSGVTTKNKHKRVFNTTTNKRL